MKTILRDTAIAAAFLVIGFVAADRMATAHAAPQQAAREEAGSAFSGVNGTISSTSPTLFVIRDGKVYKLNTAAGGDNNRVRPWVVLE